MRECLKCGGSLYRDADTYCDHDFGEPPEPEVGPVLLSGSREYGYMAAPPVTLPRTVGPTVTHPTRDGAIAEWKERYRWGQFVGALFRTLTAWAAEGSQRIWPTVDQPPLGRAPRFLDKPCGRCGETMHERNEFGEVCKGLKANEAYSVDTNAWGRARQWGKSEAQRRALLLECPHSRRTPMEHYAGEWCDDCGTALSWSQVQRLASNPRPVLFVWADGTEDTVSMADGFRPEVYVRPTRRAVDPMWSRHPHPPNPVEERTFYRHDFMDGFGHQLAAYIEDPDMGSEVHHRALAAEAVGKLAAGLGRPRKRGTKIDRLNEMLKATCDPPPTKSTYTFKRFASGWPSLTEPVCPEHGTANYHRDGCWECQEEGGAEKSRRTVDYARGLVSGRAIADVHMHGVPDEAMERAHLLTADEAAEDES